MNTAQNQANAMITTANTMNTYATETELQALQDAATAPMDEELEERARELEALGIGGVVDCRGHCPGSRPMTVAGHQWAALVSMLAGETLPVPPATGAARQHHVDGFSPATEKHLARVFGNEDRANFRPIECTGAGFRLVRHHKTRRSRTATTRRPGASAKGASSSRRC